MLQVYKECCQNCLLSPDRIVSAKRAKELIQSCAKDQTHFICHKATQEGKDIACASFFKHFGHVSQNVRIAQRCGAIELVEQPESVKLPTWDEMKSKK